MSRPVIKISGYESQLIKKTKLVPKLQGAESLQMELGKRALRLAW